MITIDRTRTLADERGISLSFLCRKMDVAKAYFLDREKAHKEIPDEKLRIIADHLHTTVEYLRGITDQKEMPVTETDKAVTATQKKLNILARHLDNIPEEKREKLIQNFEDTIDMYLDAMGIPREDE